MAVGLTLGLALGGGVAGAALTGTDAATVHDVATVLRAQANRLDALVTSTTGVTTTSATTTTVAPTTTTTQPPDSIVPAGPSCPSSTSSSTYEGRTLTVTQAVQALYGGGFRTMADLRMFVGIGRAESSLCVRVWHYHPTQSCPGFSVCSDRGWLQINNHYWPAYPDSQVLDPVGAAAAARDIVVNHGGSYGTWDTAGSAAGQQATVAQVCAAVPSTAGC